MADLEEIRGWNKWLLGILALAFVLRLVLLNEKALGVDEAVTLNVLGQNFSNAMQFVLQDFRPPLYYLVIWLLNSFSLWLAKLFGVLIGTATVFLVFQIGKMEFGEKTALLAAGIAALHPFLIGYSQHLREFGLVIFLSLLGTWFLLKTLRTPNNKNRLGWIVSSILLLYTSYLGVLILASQALFGLLWQYRKKNLKKEWAGILLPALISMVFFLPLLSLLLDQTNALLGGRIFSRSILDLGYLFAKFSSGFTLSFMAKNTALLIPVILLNIGFWGTVFLSIRGWKKFPKTIASAFFLLLGIFVLVAIKFPLFLNYRYLSFLVPLFILVSAHFFAESVSGPKADGKSRKAILKKLLVALLFIGLLYSVFMYYTVIQVLDWDMWFGL